MVLQTGITAFLAAGIVSVVGLLSQQIQEYSAWMAVYAGSLSIKRYLDIRLQSSGRLQEYMNVEVMTSLARVMLMAVLFISNATAVTSIWASLALGGILAQVYFLASNRGELVGGSKYFTGANVRRLVGGFQDYKPYYMGIVLKRLKDNLVPIVSEKVFSSKDTLAAFFLAYRGVIFAAGQIRIMEAILNHRDNLKRFMDVPLLYKASVAMLGQLVCIVSSVVILLLSGEDELPWKATLLLSFMMWPIVFLVLERTKAYSSFQARAINWSMVGYVAMLLVGSAILMSFETVMIETFSVILVISEIVSLMLILFLRSDKGYV